MTPAEIIARELAAIQYAGLRDRDIEPAALDILTALHAAGIRMERDDPVTTVYGRLLRRHMDALRKGDEPRREKLFAAIEILRGEYPAECQVWEDRYDPAIRALADGGGSE